MRSKISNLQRVSNIEMSAARPASVISLMMRKMCEDLEKFVQVHPEEHIVPETFTIRAQKSDLGYFFKMEVRSEKEEVGETVGSK